MKSNQKTAALTLGVCAFVLVQSAYFCGQLRSASDRLSEAEEKIERLDRAAARGRTAVPSLSVPGGTLERNRTACATEIARLEEAVEGLLQRVGSGASPTAATVPMVVPGPLPPPADGTAGSAGLSPYQVVEVRKIIEDILLDRDPSLRTQCNAATDRWLWQRRQQLEELRETLSLSEDQRERIAAVLARQAAAFGDLITRMWLDPGAGTDPGHLRRQCDEIAKETDAGFRGILDADQAEQYGAWTRETGGWIGIRFGGSAGG